MTTSVNPKISKLLKEKGFVCLKSDKFWKDGFSFDKKDYNPIAYKDKDNVATIAEAVMWLYEKHEIWISVHLENCRGYTGFDFNFEFINDKEKTINEQEILYKTLGESVFNSPTEAYEAAIEYILNNLI